MSVADPPTTPLSVAVVNDYEVVVRGLAAMLAGHPEVEVVELDADVPVLQRVDVALYDTFAMPGMQSADIDEIAARDNVGTILLYTWRVTPDIVAEAQARGLGGVLSKAETVEGIIAALEQAHTGEFVVSPCGLLQDGVADSAEEDSAGGIPRVRIWPGRAQGLTAREAEVIGLITQGLTNQEIADRMYVSINSIKSYIRSAYRTMGVATRSQAVLWGVENGLGPDRMRVIITPTREAAADLADVPPSPN
ncbi:MAG: response regulator transcription factor [Actinomycetia bacterium]|nr:response regulator transcription factor [Actinomycetes bacterium]